MYTAYLLAAFISFFGYQPVTDLECYCIYGTDEAGAQLDRDAIPGCTELIDTITVAYERGRK